MTTLSINIIISFVLFCCPFILLGHLFEPVDAIKCYVCQSNVDPKCADPFDNMTLSITDCDAYPRQDLAIRSEYDLVEEKTSSIFALFPIQSSNPTTLRATVCRKIRQKVNGEWRTLRGCGYLTEQLNSFDGPINACKMRHGTYDIFMESCTCNTKDGCNSAMNLAQANEFLNVAIPLSICMIMMINVIRFNEHDFFT